MGNLSIIITFLSGLGIGSILSWIVKHHLERKSKLYETWLMDYKQTCDSLLNAYRELELTNADKERNMFAYYELKLKLYANDEVIKAIHKFKMSEPSSEERKKCESDMVLSMRKDLGLYKFKK